MKNLSNLIRIENEHISNVEISSVSCWLNDELSVHLNGTIILKKSLDKEEELVVKADILDKEGRVNYSLSSEICRNLKSSKDQFSLYESWLGRFFDVSVIAGITIYTVTYNKEKNRKK